MIKPTVGRVVWFYDKLAKVGDERAAIIACVHGDRCVSLTVFERDGTTRAETSVLLLQPRESIPYGSEDYCCWMPYQIGQAAKTEQLEKELSSKS